jgi:hypothetical protein
MNIAQERLMLKTLASIALSLAFRNILEAVPSGRERDGRYNAKTRLGVGLVDAQRLVWEADKVCSERREGTGTVPKADEVLRDMGASDWIKEALEKALDRDPMDAANDAEMLAKVLDRRCKEIGEEAKR